jgi:hypothetical protein
LRERFRWRARCRFSLLQQRQELGIARGSSSR